MGDVMEVLAVIAFLLILVLILIRDHQVNKRKRQKQQAELDEALRISIKNAVTEAIAETKKEGINAQP